MSDPSTEIALIETAMRENRETYYRDEAMQGRYMELVAKRDGVPVGVPGSPDSWRPPVDTAIKDLPETVVAEWQERGSGGFLAALHRAQDAIAGILLNFGDGADVAEFVSSFEQLPKSARAAVWHEASFGVPSNVKPADPDELEAFKLLDGGAAMILEWGADAPKRAAIVYERFNRMVARIAAADRTAFQNWFWGICANERRSIVWSLSGSADT